MLSGNDCWNRNVFSRWRKVAIEGDDRTCSGKVFQRVAAATGNEQRPIVVRRSDETNSSSVNDDWRRPGRSDMGTSWLKYAGAMPCWTRYTISASLKFTRSGRCSRCNITRTLVTCQYTVYCWQQRQLLAQNILLVFCFKLLLQQLPFSDNNPTQWDNHRAHLNVTRLVVYPAEIASWSPTSISHGEI